MNCPQVFLNSHESTHLFLAYAANHSVLYEYCRVHHQFTCEFTLSSLTCAVERANVGVQTGRGSRVFKIFKNHSRKTVEEK